MPPRTRKRMAPEVKRGSQIGASHQDSSGLQGSAQRGQGRGRGGGRSASGLEADSLHEH